MNKKRWLAISAVIAVACVTAVLYTQSRPPQAPPSATGAVKALSFPVQREDLAHAIEVKGKSSYQTETYIHAPFSADVKEWLVKDGEQVKQGESIFRLDETALRSDIASLQASSRKQELEMRLAAFQSTIPASDSGAAGMNEAASKQHYAQAESRRIQEELAELTLEQNKEQLRLKTDKLKLAQYKAPESGIFLFEGTKEPQAVKENDRIGKIVDVTKLQLVSMVGEFDLFRIKEGMSAEVKVDALKDTVLQGKVERISKFAKSSGATSTDANAASTFEVLISLTPDERLIAGLSLTAKIVSDQKPGALTVPTLAIQRDKEQYFVMVDTGQGTEKRFVTLGLETPEKTEVVGGLKEGETVVIQ